MESVYNYFCKSVVDNQFTVPNGYWEGTNPTYPHSITMKLQLLFLATSYMCLQLIHNVHNTVMHDSTPFKKIACRVALSIATLCIIPLALVETIARIALTYFIAIPLSLFYCSFRPIITGTLCIIVASAHMGIPLHSLYQILGKSSTTCHWLDS